MSDTKQTNPKDAENAAWRHMELFLMNGDPADWEVTVVETKREFFDGEKLVGTTTKASGGQKA